MTLQHMHRVKYGLNRAAVFTYQDLLGTAHEPHPPPLPYRDKARYRSLACHASNEW